MNINDIEKNNLFLSIGIFLISSVIWTSIPYLVSGPSSELFLISGISIIALIGFITQLKKRKTFFLIYSIGMIVGWITFFIFLTF